VGEIEIEEGCDDLNGTITLSLIFSFYTLFILTLVFVGVRAINSAISSYPNEKVFI